MVTAPNKDTELEIAVARIQEVNDEVIKCIEKAITITTDFFDLGPDKASDGELIDHLWDVFPLASAIAHGCSEWKCSIATALRYISYLGDEQVSHDRMLDAAVRTGIGIEKFSIVEIRTRLRTLPYHEYLETPHWNTTREAAKSRADYRCQVCNTNERTLHTHHRTYENRGEEKPEDLIVLCDKCHELFHKNGRLAS